MKLQILKTFLFIAVVVGSTQTFGLDPRLKFKKISSEHFDIIYDAKSYELAKIYLDEAERAYQILFDLFGLAPDKTVVVLDDSIDIANGSAMGVPRPSVNVYVNPPTSLSTIDHFSWWPRDVFLHEYAHILNMEPAKGIYRPFRFLFGSLIRPNMLLPRWYLEGLAVEMESRFNEFGRLKSTDYDSLIRALYLDSKWGNDNLSAINEVATPFWPGGQRPYFYGALLWHELVQSKSLSIIKTFNDRYAHRIPWFISQPMIDELGKPYQEFLKDTYKKYAGLAQQQILKIQEQDITKGQVIPTKNSVFNHSPEMSPDSEKLAFISQNLNNDSVIYVMKRVDDKWLPAQTLDPKESEIDLPLKEIEKTEIQKISWFPDSKKFAFDSVDTFDRTNYYYDLYTYDLETKKTKRLTKGLRAREPAVSPDGQQIVYVKAGHGKTALYAVDSEGKNETLIYTPPSYDRVSRPAYLNDKELVFMQKTEGKDRLHVLNLETKQISKILNYQAKHPVVTSQGIVFTSTQNGVENLYLVSPDFTSMRALTNSLTRIVNGTIDTKANKLIYSELTGNGPQIKLADEDSKPKVLAPVIHPIAADFPEKIQDAPNVEAQEKTYHALPYMFPQFWLPTFALVDGGTLTSIYLPGSDPTGFHSYIYNGVYDSRPGKYSNYFNYLWSNDIGQTIFSLNDYYRYFSGSETATNSQVFAIYHGTYIPGLSNDWKAIAGYEYKKSSIVEDLGAGDVERNHYLTGPMIGFTYNNTEQKTLDISPHGQSAKLTLTKYLSNSTNTDYTETFLKLSHLHTKWLPSRHVLALTAQGVASESNRNLLLGTTSSDTEYVLGGSNSAFITRGYSSGAFLGYSMAMGTLEYRFPISDVWKGPDNPRPYYLKKIHGLIFGETLTTRGVYYDESGRTHRTKIGKYYTAAGAELRADTTLFYHVPVTLKAIFGYGFEKEANGGLMLGFAIMAPSLF